METTFDSKLYKTIKITVDGTAASGKGTIVRGLQQNLDNRYKTFDAGLMYRALTYNYIKKGINADELKIMGNLEAVLNQDINISLSDSGLIILNGDTIDSSVLRGPEIDPYVAKYSGINEVKSFIVSRQKNIIAESNCGWILDGRCMGTAVAPQAQVKFYVDAPLLARATRRHGDYIKAGKLDYSGEEVLIELQNRDKLDKRAKIAPLKKPHDAININTYQYSPNGVVEKALTLVKHKIMEAGKI